MKPSEYLRGMLQALPTVDYDDDMEKRIVALLEAVESWDGWDDSMGQIYECATELKEGN